MLIWSQLVLTRILKLPFCKIKDITSLNKTVHISAKTKSSNFSLSNSNFSILTPAFPGGGFYNSYFQNPSENSEFGVNFQQHIKIAQHIPSYWLSSGTSMHWMSLEKDVTSRSIFGANCQDRIGSCRRQSWRHDITTCLRPGSAS